MSRNVSLAVAFLASALSGHALADGIHSFSQAKTAGVKINADVPVISTAAVKLTGRVKRGRGSGILRL